MGFGLELTHHFLNLSEGFSIDSRLQAAVKFEQLIGGAL